jgi:hypothetical protein
MHEPAKPESIDIKALWREQPRDELQAPSPGGLALHVRRLHAMTRSDILTAVTAILFFATVMVWRLEANKLVTASLVLIIVWGSSRSSASASVSGR